MEDRKLVLTVFIATLTTILVIIGAAGNEEPRSVEAKGYFVGEGEKIKVTLELAETPVERRKGLMNRTELAENHGMLFVFPGEKERAFWMKNTYIPLDMIFIDSNGTVVDIRKAYPAPDTPESELKKYVGGPAKYVLEVNQNFTERKGIEVGYRFYFNRTG